jgi:hypothetical protein
LSTVEGCDPAKSYATQIIPAAQTSAHQRLLKMVLKRIGNMASMVAAAA